MPLLQVRKVPSDRAAVAFERFCERVGQPIPSVAQALRITVTAVFSDVESATLTADRALELLEELRERSRESSVWSDPLREMGGIGLAELVAAARTPQLAVVDGRSAVGREWVIGDLARAWLAANPQTVAEIVATRCGFPMDREWVILAAERRAAEDGLIARYRADFFGDGVLVAVDRTGGAGSGGPGVGFAPGMRLMAIDRRSAWPETQMVLDLRWDVFPGRRVVMMTPIWPPALIREPDPPYNGVLWANVMEWLHGRGRMLRRQSSPVIYDVGENRYDLDPPALGDPPEELMRARSEIDDIRRRWTADVVDMPSKSDHTPLEPN